MVFWKAAVLEGREFVGISWKFWENVQRPAKSLMAVLKEFIKCISY